MDPCFETATRLARAIRNGRLSAREATEAHLERIARLDGKLHSFIALYANDAILAAEAAEKATLAASLRRRCKVASVSP